LDCQSRDNINTGIIGLMMPLPFVVDCVRWGIGLWSFGLVG